MASNVYQKDISKKGSFFLNSICLGYIYWPINTRERQLDLAYLTIGFVMEKYKKS